MFKKVQKLKLFKTLKTFKFKTFQKSNGRGRTF